MIKDVCYSLTLNIFKLLSSYIFSNVSNNDLKSQRSLCEQQLPWCLAARSSGSVWLTASWQKFILSSCRSTYSGKVFQVTLLSLGGFLLLPLLVIILILESPIHPEAFRWVSRPPRGVQVSLPSTPRCSGEPAQSTCALQGRYSRQDVSPSDL